MRRTRQSTKKAQQPEDENNKVPVADVSVTNLSESVIDNIEENSDVSVVEDIGLKASTDNIEEDTILKASADDIMEVDTVLTASSDNNIYGDTILKASVTDVAIVKASGAIDNTLKPSVGDVFTEKNKHKKAIAENIQKDFVAEDTVLKASKNIITVEDKIVSSNDKDDVSIVLDSADSLTTFLPQIEHEISEQTELDLLLGNDSTKSMTVVDDLALEGTEGLMVLDSVEEDFKVGDPIIELIDDFVKNPVQESILIEDSSDGNFANGDKDEVKNDGAIQDNVVVLDEVTSLDEPNDVEKLDSIESSKIITAAVANSEFSTNVEDTENVSDDELPGPKLMELPEDTEVVSEDELPPTTRKNRDNAGEPVKDAENVSDDELPGPKLMELPADTEVVSEDELPVPNKKSVTKVSTVLKRKRSVDDVKDMSSVTEDIESANKKQALSQSESESQGNKSVQDAENVSDDELPGPKPMELPADTEVVSEDELPTPKKDKNESDVSNRKRKNDETDESMTVSTDETSNKKQAIAKSTDPKPQSADKSDDKSTKTTTNDKPPALPDLPKYWKAVTDDPADFTGWTFLLQYVEVENDVDAAREAYDAFLSHYPYCYGYWRKYADYEKRKKAGSKKKCLEVLERGLKAIPLSVDLWLHYLNHIKANSEDVDSIRQQFERAISTCGMEFRSDRLWELYIKWENEFGSPVNVTAVYDRLLAMPTLGYSSHFSNFQEHVMSHSANVVVPIQEFVKLRTEVRRDAPVAVTLDADLPPGEDEADDHLRSEEEGNAIKEQIIAARRKVHKQTAEEVSQRWTYEEAIKRPYFHVKPLEKCQLKNWKSYIEWEKEHGGTQRTLILFERCLIACALYEDYWQRYVDFLQELSDTDDQYVSQTRDALQRACTVHHPDSPSLHSNWAVFEELQGNVTKAADILDKLYKKFPNLLDVAFARVELERRRGNFDQVSSLYEAYIATAKSKWIASALAVKFARFLHFIKQDSDGALKVLSDAAAADPLCERIYLQKVDIALHRRDGVTDVDEVAKYFDAFINNESAKFSSRLAFSARKVELLEGLGSSLAKVKAAEKEQRLLVRAARKARRKSGAAEGESSPVVQTVAESKQAEKKAPANEAPAPQQPSYAYNAGYAQAPPQYGHQVPYDANAYQQQPYNSWGQYHHQQQQPNPYPPNPWGQYRNYY